MKRFENALFKTPRAKALEEFLQPYLALTANEIDDHRGTFQETLTAQMVKRFREERLAHPRMQDKAFDAMRAALKAAESPTQPERRDEPCKSRS